MMRKCDGTDPNLHDEHGQPCTCGLRFDDVDRTVIYPHQPVGGLGRAVVAQIRGVA